jgi:4-amino-4-deoxy-L-arabinose transferase-like glycosyltransferase
MITARKFANEPWLLLICLLSLVYLILIFSTFLDYGITYDEQWHSTYGEYIIRWFTSGFQDKSALKYWTLPLQGGFFDTIARLGAYLLPFGRYESTHLINALFGFLGVVAVYKLGSLLASPLTGFLSALFLVLTPRFYGHSFNNPKDIPMAVLSTFVVYYLIRAVPYLPRIPTGLLIKLGVLLGLTLAVRVGAVILAGYIVVAFGLWLAATYFVNPNSAPQHLDLRSNSWKLLKIFLAVCFIAYLVMLVWWPAAQVRPIRQPLKGLWLATHFEQSIDVYFEGATISNKDLPWYYVLKWFLITMPEFYFLALAAGLIMSIKLMLARGLKIHSLSRDRALSIFIVIFGIIFPVGYTVLTKPTDYDGIRHFLFVVPLLAVLAAFCLTMVLDKAGPSFFSIVLVIMVLASGALTAVDMIQLHPYQYIYFNRLFGKGVAQAANSFDTDYWGSSYKEGVEWVVNNYEKPDHDRKIKVVSCLHALSTSYFLPEDRFEYLGTFHDGKEIPENAEPDLFLATTRWSGHKKLEGKLLHVISRKNVPLLYIIEVSHDSDDNTDKV